MSRSATRVAVPVLGIVTVLVALAALFALAALEGPAHAQAPEPAPPDSLAEFFKGLADSTDASFGATSVAFDTTGLDSLIAHHGRGPGVTGRTRGDLRTSWFPVLGFHRASGPVLGAGMVVSSAPFGVLTMRGSYGFDNKAGRYEFGYRRNLWHPGQRITRYENLSGGRIGEGTRLDVDLRYARETVAFMPEHADPDNGAVGSFMNGRVAQSVYEMRGFTGRLLFWTGDWAFHAGYRNAKDRMMPLVTRWSLFGAEDQVPINTLATDESYSEPLGGIAFRRIDWELGARLDARGGGSDRWRIRGVLGKAFRLGQSLKTHIQIEGGAAAANAPRQRRFEIGGAKLIPSLPYGVGGTDHLLGAKVEFTHAANVLQSIGLRKPDWLVLQPLFFAQAAAAWDDPGGRNVVFSKPPGEFWRGTAGFGMISRFGIPDPDVWWRIELGWPVGTQSGDLTLNFSLGRRFDLLGTL